MEGAKRREQWPAPVFGTMERDDDDPEAMYRAVREALRVGYRHFDLAEHYTTQEQVGRALFEFLAEQQQQVGTGEPRSTLFITSKYDGLPLGPYPIVKARVQAMLSKCQLSHFDLLLIHYPTPAETTDLNGDPFALCTPERWEHFEAHCGEAWRNMSSLREDGLCSHVGLSNCYAQHVEYFARHAAQPSLAPIYANEIFVDVAHPETDFVASMQAAGIRVFAYRPLAFLPNLEMLGDMGAPQVATAIDAAMAATQGGGGGCVSWQQLILAWLLSRDISPITSSTSPAHIAANYAAAGEKRAVAERLSSATAIGSPSRLLQEALRQVGESLDMVEMVGGMDEFAAAFRRMGAEHSAAAATAMPAPTGLALTDSPSEQANGTSVDAAVATPVPSIRVALIGDSTIDNVVWVEAASDSVTEVLKRELGRDAAVTNLAADGFTSADCLHGAPADISAARRAEVGDALPVAHAGEAFEPLRHLASMAPPPTHVVLSVGGNDVREVLGAMHELPARIAAFHSNYPAIVQRIQEACPDAQVIIMLQYRPDLTTDTAHYGVYHAVEAAMPGQEDSVSKLNALMESIYPPVLELARKQGFDVLDMPNTFDIHDSGLYRCQIEPSAKGSALICRLIAHAVTDGGGVAADAAPAAARSRLFSVEGASGGVVARPNDGRTPWRIAR